MLEIAYKDILITQIEIVQALYYYLFQVQRLYNKKHVRLGGEKMKYTRDALLVMCQKAIKDVKTFYQSDMDCKR